MLSRCGCAPAAAFATDQHETSLLRDRLQGNDEPGRRWVVVGLGQARAADGILPAIRLGTSWMWSLTACSTASGSPERIASTMGRCEPAVYSINSPRPGSANVA